MAGEGAEDSGQIREIFRRSSGQALQFLAGDRQIIACGQKSGLVPGLSSAVATHSHMVETPLADKARNVYYLVLDRKNLSRPGLDVRLGGMWARVDLRVTPGFVGQCLLRGGNRKWQRSCLCFQPCSALPLTWVLTPPGSSQPPRQENWLYPTFSGLQLGFACSSKAMTLISPEHRTTCCPRPP